MGIYLNPDNTNFSMQRNNDIFVDKSLLIQTTNHCIGKSNHYLCVSRPRRFGKSFDANMLVAYYTKICDSSSLFDDLKIAGCEDYKKHLNKYNVIYLDMHYFYSKNRYSIEKMISEIYRMLMIELKLTFPDVYYYDDNDFLSSIKNVYDQTRDKFIFIIDEWDCVFRVRKYAKDNQEEYLDFFRNLLKDQPYVEFAYMTGILPIKKYNTQSALNMFDEVSMINSSPLESSMGFTETEIKELCDKYDMDFNEMKEWYNGYQLENNFSVYCPNSIVKAIEKRKYNSYWTQTESYESLRIYIDMNFEGLKEDIISMLAGKRIHINPNKFENDMVTFHSKDDIFTLLVHLGYLGYNSSTKEVYIPNNEIMEQFENTIEDSFWQETAKSVQNSKDLLEATWSMNEEKVAYYIEQTH